MINVFLALNIGYGVPRIHYFCYNSKIPLSDHFGLIGGYPKIPKGLVLSIGAHKHDLRTQRESSNQKWLTFEDHGLRETR